MARICGHMFPLNALDSTVLRTTGTSKTLAALQRISLLLMMDWRSKVPTPESICGCRAIMVTRQVSGVSSPLLLRLGSDGLVGLDLSFYFVCLIAICFA